MRAVLRPHLPLLLAALLLGLVFTHPAVAEQAAALAPSCLQTHWPQEQSDLAPDPALHFGRLDNGLRYVLMANAKPEQRVAMYLNVRSGSIHETEEQRGLAHFLEHMLFNGTTHYPPGTLVEYFQKLGMGFGGDTNAHTGFDETVYNLLLPTNDPHGVAEGFKVLADYARGALLLDKEVERERGVILAEKRSRDSAATRVSKRQMQFDFAGSLVAEREPIGTEAVLNAADSRLLRGYYDRWYRPENMIVVVVGDIAPEAVAPLLTAAFAPLQGQGTVEGCPDLGQVAAGGTDILVHGEAELGYTGLALTTVFNRTVQPDTLHFEIEQLRRFVATHLLASRLKQLEQQPGSPLAQAHAQGGIFLQRYGYGTLTARAVSGKWQEALTLLQGTLQQAVSDGFSAAELSRSKREVGALLTKAAQTATTRDSRELAEEIIRKLNDEEVVLSPAQELALYGPVLEKMTLEEVNAALRQLWSSPRRLVEVVGVLPADLAVEQPEQRVRSVFDTARQQGIKPWVEEKTASFPYLPLPAQQGKVLEQTEHAPIGVQSYLLEGGVRLNVKTTDFQANQVLVSVQFGQGKESEPQPGMALLAQAVIPESGLGQLTSEQLQQALAGSTVELGFKVGPENFTLAGGALTSDFEQLVQLLYHRLHDPALRSDAFTRSREGLQRMYGQMVNTVEGVQQIEGERFLAGACPEYGLASWEEVERIDLEQIRSWLAPIFAQAPLEINVVGDIAADKALALISRYLGAEQRQSFGEITDKPPLFPAGKELRLNAPSTIDRGLLTVAWQTSDFWDIGRTRRLNLLAAVLDDRLRVKIREELGATYSPRVVSQPSRALTGFGLLQSSLIVAPEQAASLAGVIKAVAAGLGEQGVSEDELRRALEPTLTSIKDLKRSNRYWMESVLNLSSRHPQQLQWPLTILEGFAAIKAEELTQLAGQYLKPEQAATVIVSPESKR